MSKGRKSSEKSESLDFFTKKWETSEEKDRTTISRDDSKSSRATKSVDEVQDFDSKDSLPSTPGQEEQVGSKFTKNQKLKKQSSKFKDKFKNVWKRSDSKKKGSSDEEEEAQSQYSEHQTPTTFSKSAKTSTTSPFTTRDNTVDRSSNDEDEESTPGKLSTVPPSPSIRNSSRNAATDSEQDPEEISEDGRPDSRARPSSGSTIKEEKTESPKPKQQIPEKRESIHKPHKTSSKVILADETTTLAKHGVPDPNIWNVVSFESPLLRTSEDIKSLAQLIFYPSSKPLTIEQKLPEDVSVRFIEDEGIFVGKPLKISPRNLHRLEHRIFMEKSLEWFGQDGNLISFPDPYRPERIQLCQDEETCQSVHPLILRRAQVDPFQEFHIDPKMSYEIVVDVGQVHFNHHPLFSPEHVLASRLEYFFQEYSRRKESMVTERSENRLKALREALHHCKQTRSSSVNQLKTTPSSNGSPSTIHQLDDRINRYRNDMKITRKERNDSWKADKKCITNVLDSWKAVKSIREQQGYTNTTLKLNIMTVEESYALAKQVWKAEIEQELDDIRQEYEDEYKTAMSQYKEELREWTEARRRRKNKLKKRKQRQSDNRDSSDHKGHRGSGDEVSDGDSDKSDSSIPSISTKPTPPSRFDEDTTRSEIIALFNQIRKLPGEPKLELELTKTVPITAKTQLAQSLSKEIQRRKAVEKTRIEFKLVFNQKEVYRSPPKDLNPEFSIFFGLTIPISVREWPESLKIYLIESYKSSRAMVAEVTLPLPNRKTSIERCHLQKVEFESTEIIKTNHTGVGSGTPFTSYKEENEGLFTTGFLNSRIGWSADKEGNVICPRGFDKVHETEEAKMFDASTRELLQTGDIQKWSETTQLDPNDPRNAKLIHAIARKLHRSQYKAKDKEDMVSGLQSPLGTDMFEEETDFCSPMEIEKSIRCKLLRLRDEEIAEFRNFRMVPCFDRDIPSSVFDPYERRLKEEANKKEGDTASKLRKRMVEDDLDYELNRLEKIKEIRTKVFKLFQNSLRQITFDDIIVEEQIPDIGTLGLNIMTLFQPRRPLRPTRRERKRVQGSSLAETKLTLIVNIVRAFNLPMRKDTEIGLLTTEAVTGVPLLKKRNGGSFTGLSTVKPFAEVWFQRNVCRTTTALGANPTWNQELQLVLTVPEDDYSQENLSKMDDLVYLLVYDEVAVDLLEDDRRRDTDIYQRLEKRWLGSITIPFSTLYTNGRIEGTFKLNSPSILLGYEAQGMSTHFISPMTSSSKTSGGFNRESRANINSSISNQKNTFMTLFMTLQPAIQRSSISKEETATGETADMMSHVTSWKQGIINKFPERNIKPFVMNMDGETILCIRYLKSISPPEGLVNPELEVLKTMEDLAHFVSLFPSIRDSTLGITDYSLWFTSDTFVATPGGGTEDHAVLLACFFMYLNIPCWILQGNAIPDGPTAYVLTSFKGVTDRAVPKHFKNNHLIWNPCSGEYFLSNDNFCPLQKVWAVIGSANIWANVMENDRPHQLDWDFAKASNWKPLFSKPVEESKVSSVQVKDIVFKPADQTQANSLAQRIERHLKEVIMKWRKSTKTKWNRYCTAILRRLLPRLEEIKSGKNRTHPRTADDGSVVAESVHSIMSADTPANFSEEHLIELRDVIATYEMTGFPLHQSYTNFESVTEAVFATGVHTIDTPNVEFAVAAYSRSYPAGVYSMWIYIAALHKRK